MQSCPLIVDYSMYSPLSIHALVWRLLRMGNAIQPRRESSTASCMPYRAESAQGFEIFRSQCCFHNANITSFLTSSKYNYLEYSPKPGMADGEFTFTPHSGGNCDMVLCKPSRGPQYPL